MTCWPILLYGTSSFQWYRSEDTCIIHAVKDQDVYHMRHASWIHALRKYGYMHYECMHYKYLRHGQKHYGCMHHGYLQAAPWIHAYCIMDTRSKDTSAWVMRLERPKGVKDGVKLALVKVRWVRGLVGPDGWPRSLFTYISPRVCRRHFH